MSFALLLPLCLYAAGVGALYGLCRRYRLPPHHRAIWGWPITLALALARSNRIPL